MDFAIKTPVTDRTALSFVFDRQKTMYDGKRIQPGDTVYIFDSENEGGLGLIARGTVTASVPTPRAPGIERQTPRVGISVRRTADARTRLGRVELRGFADRTDGQPQTELNFKLYRQATNKIVALSDEAAAFLAACF